MHHPVFCRRTMLQAGAVGLLGLGSNHLAGLRALAANAPAAKARAVIYIFLSGGLAQHDSFDLKPGRGAGVPRRVQADRHAHPRHPDLRAPAAAGRAQSTSGRWSAR